MNQKAKALIFDLDGTLADTIPAITEAVNMALSKLGYPSRTEKEVTRFIGKGPRHLISRALNKDDVAENKELIDKALALYDQTYEKTYMYTNTLYDGLLDVLIALSSRYTITVLSNKQDQYVKALITQLLPEGICKIARGSLSGVPAKPEPTIALQLVRELGVLQDECILIGDSEIDILTAKNSGFDIISVSWGYADSKKLLEHGAKKIVDSPIDLLNRLV